MRTVIEPSHAAGRDPLPAEPGVETPGRGFLVVLDAADRPLCWDAGAAEVLGLAPGAGPLPGWDLPWDRWRVADGLRACRETGRRLTLGALRLTREEGGGEADVDLHPLGAGGPPGSVLMAGLPLSGRMVLETRKQHARKLEAVGQLAAGIAHEINTPVQFVGDNLRFMRNAVAGLRELVELLPALLEPQTFEGDLQAARERVQELDPGYLASELPDAITEALEGVERVAVIVQAMKDFAHQGREGFQASDINQDLLTTLTLARNAYKYVADVETELGDLPPVECSRADLNQVWLNLVVNAADALAEQHGSGSKERGLIRITTRREGGQAVVTVGDTGPGIPEDVQPRIFEHFFTTKDVGKGSGQGLAIVRAVVVEKHGGSVSCESTPGLGTTFTVRLPLKAGGQAPGEGPTRVRERVPAGGTGP